MSNTIIVNGINITEKLHELEELKKDVARFMELKFSDYIKQSDWPEYLALKDKLSKVGK